MSDTFCHGDNSYFANASRMSSGEVAAMFPDGWGQPGETRSGTIHTNAVEGQWLPLFIPEGCDGHLGAHDPDTGELLPEVILYASAVVKAYQDQHWGPAHSSEEADAARYQYAVDIAIEAAKSTSGGAYVRE